MELEYSLSKPKPRARALPDEAKKLSITLLMISLPLLYVALLPLPLSSLLHDTVFWFLVSNSIILIIALDSNCIFSSNHACDFYDEFIKHSRTRQVELTTLPFPTKPSMKMADCTDHCEEQRGAPPAKIDDGEEKEVHENSVNKRLTPLNKSASTKFETSMVDGPTMAPLRRSATEKKIEYEVRDDEEGTEADEYSSMSIEELNERVEEFIRRFNREMRLQNE